MSDFVDNSASESEDDNKSGSDSSSVDSSEEEEEDETAIVDGLIDDNPIEEEEASEDDSDADIGKRKARSDEDDQLEDDDFDLLEENLGIKMQRKKHKRIKVMSDDEDSDDEGKDGRDAEMVANQIFGDDDDDDHEDSRAAAAPTTGEQYGDLDDSEMESDPDDFIVDEDGQPISKGKKKKHVVHSDKALQEAQDVFGVDFDFGDFDQFASEDDAEEDEEEYEDEEAMDDGAEPRARKKHSRRQKKSIFEVFEPSELERGHMTDVDQEIRMADMPERFHLRSVKVTAADSTELTDEAEWIYTNAFAQTTISTQVILIPANLRVDIRLYMFAYHGNSLKESLDLLGSRSIVQKIRSALDFLRNQQLEVPFIAFYRKEYVQPELKIAELWRIWHWDEKWVQLRARKQNLQKLMERMQEYQFEMNKNPDVLLPAHVRTLMQEDVDKVHSIESTEEYWDVYNHFMLYYGKDLQAMKDAEKKRKKEKKAPAAEKSNEEKEEGEEDEDPEEEKADEIPQESLKYARGRNSGYQICVQAGLLDLAKKFGLTPEQFADNLRDNYQKNEVEQHPTEPMELASEYTGQQFEDAAEVLNGVRHLVSMQIAYDPVVRKCVRQVFRDRARLAVRPTKKGRKEVDEQHPCFSVKYIRDKPVNDLKNDMFLKLQTAVDDGLLTMDISLGDAPGSNSFLEEIRPLYHRDEYSALVQAWNAQRFMALERALTKLLYPQLEKELKMKLITEAKEGIIRSACQKLKDSLKIAPYQPDQEFDGDDDFDLSRGLRIMSIAYKNDRDIAGFACMLDAEGEVSDFLRLPAIMKRKNHAIEVEKQEKLDELDKLKDFILQKKPHVIAIGGESREAIDIQYDVQALLNQLEDESQFPKLTVELIDNDAAITYSNAKRSTQDYPDYPTLLKESISIARRLRDPLTEFSQLCNQDEDLLCLRLHPLQDQVSREALLNGLYLEFVNVTNEVGVDINDCLAHPYTAGLLQFVCGLGPRKAAYILKQVKSHNRLVNRSQLVTHCHMGPKVFINCSGFIRVDTSHFGESTEEYTDVLDGSRVHPETYEWARKMAIDALEYDDTAEDANPAAALEEILESPERLRDLDLEAFSVELERQGYGQKLTTLYDIRAELNSRYKDSRTPYSKLENVERFNMLTKETPDTLYIGKMVLCRVTGIARRKPQGQELDEAQPEKSEDSGMWVCPFCKKDDFAEISEVWSHFDAGTCLGSPVGVRVMLDNNMKGFIHCKNLSDKEVKNPEDRVKVGMTLHARILKINIENFQADLTCKTSDLLDKEDRLKPAKDTFYDNDLEASEKDADEAKKKNKAKQSYVKRVIAHPSFHNVGYKECEKILEGLDQGDCVIRPSSKGADHLTLSWHIGPGIYSHVDIREEGKENAFSLGKTLFIGTEEFEDLDEIIARFLQPMAAFARELQGYKYYCDESDGGSRDIMDKKVYEEKRKAPTRIPYFFTTSKEFPGKFMLSYMPRDRTVHEFVTVTHEGLRFRGSLFHSLGAMIKWFKEHFRDAIPQRMVTPSTATPNISNVDPALLRRAAGLPPTFRSGTTPGATPSYNTSRGQYPGRSYGNQTSGTPMMTPSLMTPSYHTSTTGGTPAGYRATPRTTPRPPAGYPGGTPSQNARATPRSGTSRGGNTPRGGTTPRGSTTPRHGPSTSRGTPRSGGTPRDSGTPRDGRSSGSTPQYRSSRAPNMPSKDETDWAKMAQMWAQQTKTKGRGTGGTTPS